MTARALVLAVFVSVPALAQPSPFAFGGFQEDVAVSVDADASGAFAIGGTTYGGYDPDPGSSDATIGGGGRIDGFAAVYGPDGAFRFAVPFGPPGPSAADEVFSVALGPSGELAVAGQVGETLDLDPGPGQSLVEAPGFAVHVFLAVYEPDGSLRYGFAVPGFDFAQRASVDVDDDGNVYLLGSVSSPADLDPGDAEVVVDGFRSATLVSYTPDGDFRWGFLIDGAQYRARGLAVTGDRVAITGDLLSGSVDIDPGPAVRDVEGSGPSSWLTAVYTTSGNLATAFVVGSSAFGGVADVALDADGTVALVGTIDRDADFDPGDGVVTLPGNGNGSAGLGVLAVYTAEAQLREASSLGAAQPRGVAIDGGRVVWTGHTDEPFDADPGAGETLVTPVGGFDVVTVSFGSGGEFEWVSTVAGPGSGDNGLGVALAGGRSIVTGRFSGTVDVDPGAGEVALSSSSNFDYDVYTVAYDRDGALAARPTPSERGPEASTLRLGPSPTTGTARVWVPAHPASVRVDVLDALGRRVAVLYNGPGGLDVQTPRLAPGVYTVRTTAGASARLVVVR